VVNASPSLLYPGKETGYPLYRRLCGPQGWSGRVRKISPPPGFNSRTVQHVSESLYRLSYVGSADGRVDRRWSRNNSWREICHILCAFAELRNATRLTGTLHEDLCAFMIISFSMLLETRSVWDKSCRETQNTHLMLNNIFFPHRKSCRLWNNVEKYGKAKQATNDHIIRRVRFEYWITKVTHTQNI
jgi:transposase